MSDEKPETENLFDNLGLSLKFEDDIKLGEIYPIYGAITKILNDTPGKLVVLINDSVEAKLNVVHPDKIALIKNRAFDSGIFVCTITEIEPTIKAECSTIVFGKNNNTVQ
jgi:hypothetical protein